MRRAFILAWSGILLAVAGCGMPVVPETESTVPSVPAGLGISLPEDVAVPDVDEVVENASAFLSEMSEMASEMASSVSVEDLSEPEEAAGESVPTDQTQEQSAAAAAAETVVSEAQGLLAGMEELDIHDTDGKGSNYAFAYAGETYTATFRTDRWRIYDSYKITNEADMKLICQALIDIHPVLGSDGISFRTPEDMVYEWKQHNLAYAMLPEGSDLRRQAKDVDLDPYDQGRSLEEIYEDRTGRSLQSDLEEQFKQKAGEYLREFFGAGE